VYRTICHAVKHLIYSDERKQLFYFMAIACFHFRKEILCRMTNVVLSVMTLHVLFCNDLLLGTRISDPTIYNIQATIYNFKKEILSRMTNVVLSVMTLLVLFFYAIICYWRHESQIPQYTIYRLKYTTS
jgi:hypothetical protein